MSTHNFSGLTQPFPQQNTPSAEQNISISRTGENLCTARCLGLEQAHVKYGWCNRTGIEGGMGRTYQEGIRPERFDSISWESSDD